MNVLRGEKDFGLVVGTLAIGCRGVYSSERLV